MPRVFVNHFNGPALCKLLGPTGKSWDVKLKEKNNDIFFHKGWKKFLKDNFLDEGDFLVFKYDGDSCFNVTIYDESECEMDMDMEVAKTKRIGGDLRRDHVPPGESRIIEFNLSIFALSGLVKHRMYQLVTSYVWANIIYVPTCTIPMKIGTGKLHMSKQILKLWDPKNSSWPVAVAPKTVGRLLMNTCWRDCCKANQIEEGHTMIFEVKGHMKLHIFRAEGFNVILTGPNVVD